MLGVLIAAAVLSGVLAYVVGYALIAPRESVLRSKAGGMVLAASVLVALVLPPILVSLIRVGDLAVWPVGLNEDVYRYTWVALMVSGLLGGLRVWRMRWPSWRGGTLTLDESPVSRVEAQLPLVDSLDAALDVLSREKLAAKDVARIAPQLRLVGNRFWFQVPERNSDVYKLVANHIPPAAAAAVTGLLLEGAERKK